MQDRLVRVNRILGLPDGRPLLMVNARGKGLSDVWEGVQRGVVSQDVGLVVVDSLSRSGVGDLSENAPMNKAIDMLNGFNVAFLVIAHAAWEFKHEFGSVMQRGAVGITVRHQHEEQRAVASRWARPPRYTALPLSTAASVSGTGTSR